MWVTTHPYDTSKDSQSFNLKEKVETEALSRGKVKLTAKIWTLEDEQTLGVHSKQLMQHRLISSCTISERRRLEAETEKDMMMTDECVDLGGCMVNSWRM